MPPWQLCLDSGWPTCQVGIRVDSRHGLRHQLGGRHRNSDLVSLGCECRLYMKAVVSSQVLPSARRCDDRVILRHASRIPSTITSGVKGNGHTSLSADCPTSQLFIYSYLYIAMHAFRPSDMAGQFSASEFHASVIQRFRGRRPATSRCRRP